MSTRILIVEDEQIVAEDLSIKLRLMGHDVVGSAASGEEGLRLATSLHPDLILMDVRLQGAMNGAEAARRIQEVMDIPIVYVSAFSELFIANPALMQPPGMCLSKPFSTYQLRTVIDVALESASKPK
jgi:two-component system, cell cycle sensor histidine kinase and response regulator CckA